MHVLPPEGIERATREGYFTPVPGRPLWLCPILVPAKLSTGVMTTLLECLTALDSLYLRAYPQTPWLYSAGVRYEREPPGQEQWLTVPFVLLRRDNGGGADCEDLSCWRAAELQVKRGEEDAKAIFTHRQNPKTGRRMYHIKTQRGRAGGRRVEDPSAALGMGREWAARFGETHSIVDGEKY